MDPTEMEVLSIKLKKKSRGFKSFTSTSTSLSKLVIACKSILSPNK